MHTSARIYVGHIIHQNVHKAKNVRICCEKDTGNVNILLCLCLFVFVENKLFSASWPEA